MALDDTLMRDEPSPSVSPRRSTRSPRQSTSPRRFELQDVGHSVIKTDTHNDQNGEPKKHSTLTSGSTRKRKAPAVRPRSWDFHKDTIRRLFLDENKPLHEVMKILRHEHNFDASERQYKSQIKTWNWQKNFKADEIASIVRIQNKRQMEGKETTFTVRGVKVDPKKISRWVKNIKKEDDDAGPQDAQTPSEIEYFTGDLGGSGDELEDTDSAAEESATRHQDPSPRDFSLFRSPSPVGWIPDVITNDGSSLGVEASEDPSLVFSRFNPFSSHPAAKRLSASSALQDIDSEDSLDQSCSNKRPKTGARGPLSCPYRKRNPSRFNVRDWVTCSVTGFATISDVKRHIRTCHVSKTQARFRCTRCWKTFDVQDALSSHLAQSDGKFCEPVPPTPEVDGDPEDGISTDIDRLLVSRKIDEKVDTWGDLWKTIFPNEAKQPPAPDFVPLVELQEFEQSVEEGIDTLRQEIRKEVDEATHGVCRPELVDAIASRALNAVRNFLDNNITKCRQDRVAGTSSLGRSRISRSKSQNSLSKRTEAPPDIRITSEDGRDEKISIQPPRSIAPRTSRPNSMRSTDNLEGLTSNQFLAPERPRLALLVPQQDDEKSNSGWSNQDSSAAVSPIPSIAFSMDHSVDVPSQSTLDQPMEVSWAGFESSYLHGPIKNITPVTDSGYTSWLSPTFHNTEFSLLGIVEPRTEVSDVDWAYRIGLTRSSDESR